MTLYLADYAQFKFKGDMNQAVEQHITAHQDILNHSDRAVLDIIHLDSLKHGAAHLKHHTIEQAIQKSNTTVRRSIRKLERLGIIKRIHYIRPVMNGLGGNIYVIRAFNKNNAHSRT